MGSLIAIGSIVKLVDGRLVRLLSASSEMPCKLLGNLFTIEQSSLPFVHPISPFVRHIRDKEVAETKRMASFFVSDIADPAFVFLIDDVEEQGLCMHGIANAYFT
jgi:hypothetical protein